jgi:tripartite-type tricarboxylate transporter receptor subunit TctC
MAPAATPRAVVDRLNQEISRIVGQPEVRQLWGRQGATPMVMTPQEFDKYMREDIAKWAAVIKSADIKAD